MSPSIENHRSRSIPSYAMLRLTVFFFAQVLGKQRDLQSNAAQKWLTVFAWREGMARGVHGQGIYIDPTAQMVIARYASHSVAGNAANDPVTLPAYMALAKDLMAGG